MNHLRKSFLCLSALVAVASQIDAAATIVPRSQSVNAARQMVGWNNPEWGINRMPQDERYYSANLTFGYTRTFRDDRLARCLFGDDLVCGDCGSTLKIQGSAVSNRDSRAWLADYFGLPRSFDGTVTFSPRIENFLIDFSLYVGLDEWYEGMYFRIHGPFVHTRWQLNASEDCATTGETGYFEGYFTDEAVAASNLTQSFLAYTNGATPSIDGIKWNSLCCSRIQNDCDCDALTQNGFGELRFVLGWNFVNDDQGDYHFGAGVYVAAPTGTRPGSDDCNGRYLFEPIVGNGKHWELGGQVTAHHIWWRSEDQEKSFGMYLEANVTHLFKARQTRCFDLCKPGKNSRYMLAQRLAKFAPDATVNLNTNVAPDGIAFADEYSPVANLTERSIKSSFAAQGDVAISLAYQSGGFQWDLGYNFWGRSCEDICLDNDCCSPAYNLKEWALKGDQRVYGFDGDSSYDAVALAATDHCADIHQGSNMKNSVSYLGDTPSAPVNRYADNPAQARSDDNNQVVYTYRNSTTQVYTSNRPVTLKDSDLDLTGTRGISHKLFTHLNYAWTNREDSSWTPYLGVGAEVEFGKTEGSCCNDDCNTDCDTGCSTTSCAPKACATVKSCCEDCAISQWGVWFKVGASYN